MVSGPAPYGQGWSVPEHDHKFRASAPLPSATLNREGGAGL